MTEGITTATDKTTAFICGVRGLALTDEERDFIRRFQPWGFIVFARNVDDRDQLSALTAELRSLCDHDAVPILVDQEGGRVQRLKPPHWTAYPSGRAIGGVYRRDKAAGLRAAWLMSRLHAFDLLEVGLNVDCLPVLDVPTPDGHDVIGDRAYGHDAQTVTELGQAACDGLMAGGVQPVIKHIPGHGRATADSHHDLPVVDADLETLRATDFRPFTSLRDIPMAMTAHVIYSAIDPNLPATTSKTVMDEIVRGEMGYDGLVMCDDITMGALSGGLLQRARAISAAGCDIILHCTGQMDEMLEVAENTPKLTDDALRRAERAVAGFTIVDASDVAELRLEFADIMGDGVAMASRDPTDYGRTA
ncbi:MAG: beta-N-acetylhexosaminidase [Pseudomonadota bacterium]